MGVHGSISHHHITDINKKVNPPVNCHQSRPHGAPKKLIFSIYKIKLTCPPVGRPVPDPQKTAKNKICDFELV